MIRLRNIEKSLRDGPAKTFVLRRIDLDIQDGSSSRSWDPSGAGKSTLLTFWGCTTNRGLGSTTLTT
jgi:ABC-type lipoprotein export system ATPase subunit